MHERHRPLDGAALEPGEPDQSPDDEDLCDDSSPWPPTARLRAPFDEALSSRRPATRLVIGGRPRDQIVALIERQFTSGSRAALLQPPPEVAKAVIR
jgi:hypothetical protein